MSWLLEQGEARESGWAGIAALAPRAVGALSEVQEEVWDHAPPVLLELARLRMASLLGATWALEARSPRAVEAGLTEEKVAALSSWPTSPLFDDTERACLDLTEQFLIDVNQITDAQVDAVRERIGTAATYAFVSALWAFEQLQRMSLVLGVAPTPDAAGLAPRT